MVDVKVYSTIANEQEGIFFSLFGNEKVFSADAVRNIFDENKNENEFRFDIHCDGGSVTEGLAIYDIIRNSGKKIFTNIEGSCHSMAITLLLAAPKENRTANPNCRALIHEVRGGAYGDLTAEEMRGIADDIEREQNTILDIYTDRTGYDRVKLEQLMKEEKIRTAQELLQYGFISKINKYSTNQKKQTMSKSKTRNEIINSAENLLAKLKNLLSPVIINYDFTDAEGNVILSTESEDDTLEVGMPATPDGEHELTDGRIVTVVDGVITEILKPEEESEVTELQNRIQELENALSESQTVITDLKNQVRSTYNVKPRMTTTAKNNKGEQKTSAERKAEVKEKMNKMKGGK